MVVIAVGVSFDDALSSSVPGHGIFEGSWVVAFEGVSEAPLEKRSGSVPVTLSRPTSIRTSAATSRMRGRRVWTVSRHRQAHDLDVPVRGN